MSKSFGTKFILVSDVQQFLNPKIFGGGPWVHLATIVRGFKEYMCFKNTQDDKTYIEYVDPTHSTLLKRIDDDIEFAEIEEFLRQAGILKVDLTKEFKIADKKH